jgi:hypothetical protein
MSVSDIFGSVTMMLQAFLVPKDTSYRVWAVGNDATCTAMGAMTQVGFGTLFYTFSLSIWYVASIRYGVTAATFSKYAEPWLHVLSIGWPLATAIYGSVLGTFKEMDLDLGCWVSDFPDGCDVDPNNNVPCKSTSIAYIFVGYPYFVSFTVILVNKILIVLHVWKGATTTSRNPAAAGTTSMEGQNRAMRSPAHASRARSVVIQSFLYVGVFLLTFFCAGTIRVLESLDVGLTSEPGGVNDEKKLLPLLVVNRILFPSVGTLNLFVFLRPQYIRVRARHKDLSRFGAFRRALKDSMDVQKLQSRQERLGRSSLSSRFWMEGSSEFATASSPQYWPRRSMSSRRILLSSRNVSGKQSGASEEDLMAHIRQVASSWLSTGSSKDSTDSAPWEGGTGMVAMAPEPIREEDEDMNEEEEDDDGDSIKEEIFIESEVDLKDDVGKETFIEYAIDLKDDAGKPYERR